MLLFTEVCQSVWKAALVAVVLLCISLTDTEARVQYKTCCAIQTNCKNCSSLYKVNSITYCCPGCQGNVLVTGLICACTVVADPRNPPTCTVSSTIVGDYPYGLTSWRSAGSLPSVSAPLLLLALCSVQLIKYMLSGLWTMYRRFCITKTVPVCGCRRLSVREKLKRFWTF